MSLDHRDLSTPVPYAWIDVPKPVPGWEGRKGREAEEMPFEITGQFFRKE